MSSKVRVRKNGDHIIHISLINSRFFCEDKNCIKLFFDIFFSFPSLIEVNWRKCRSYYSSQAFPTFHSFQYRSYLFRQKKTIIFFLFFAFQIPLVFRLMTFCGSSKKTIYTIFSTFYFKRFCKQFETACTNFMNWLH